MRLAFPTAVAELASMAMRPVRLVLPVARKPRPDGLTYMVQLDSLRAIAVAMVLIQHMAAEGTGFHDLISWGSIGVKLFFVLSGFLISSILIDGRGAMDEGTARLGIVAKCFYARRILRIFPVYYASLLLMAWWNHEENIRATLPWHLVHGSNFLLISKQTWCGAVAHLWSLSVEQQFYLVWPWVMLLVPRRFLLPAILATIAIGPAYRGYAALHGWDHMSLALPMPACLDTLGLGALLAYSIHSPHAAPKLRGRISRLGLWLGGSVFAVATLLYALRMAGQVYGLKAGRSLEGLPALGIFFESCSDLFMGLFFVWLINRASVGFGGWAGRLLEYGPLVYLGKISYGIYLFHNFVNPLLSYYAFRWNVYYPQPGLERLVIVSVGTIVAAAVSWELFEKPINGLKRHFRYATA